MYLFLIALVLLSIVPFYLVMVNATHSSFDIVTRLNLLPGASTLENYATMQSHVNIWRGFLNSLCIAVPYTAFTGYFGALAAFGFGKYRFKGRNVLFAVVLASMMIPSQLSMIAFISQPQAAPALLLRSVHTSRHCQRHRGILSARYH